MQIDSRCRIEARWTLGLLLAAFALTFPTVRANAGDAGGQGRLTGAGLLTFETGDVDRFAFYADGVFGDPDADPDPEETQDVADQGPPNNCELDTSAQTLVVSSVPAGFGVAPGFKGDSAGVFSRGGGNSRGVRCGRIDSSEILEWRLGPSYRDEDGDLNVAVGKSRIDMEFKGNAVALVTARFDGVVTGQFVVPTGTSVGAPLPPGAPANAVVIPCPNVTGQDSNNDAGANDNCTVEFPFDVAPEGPGPEDIPAALWDELTFELLFEMASVEGGGDHADFRANRSEFELLNAEGVLDCYERFEEADNFSGRRLLNPDLGDPTLCELIPYDAEYFPDFTGDESVSLASFDANTGGQNVNFTFQVCFEEEHVDTANDPTLFSFRQELDPATCEAEGACFALDRCLGTPTYQCFGFNGPIAGSEGCVPDEARCFGDPACKLCDAFELGATCELSDLAPPEAPPEPDGFPDRDDVVDGINYACTYTSEEVYSSEDKVTICEGIFLTDDAKALRRR